MCEKPLYVHRQSAYLFGRDRKVADVPTDHPSCSSQHAVLQYRLVELPQEPGFMGPPKRTVKPYIMDLGALSQAVEAELAATGSREARTAASGRREAGQAVGRRIRCGLQRLLMGVRSSSHRLLQHIGRRTVNCCVCARSALQFFSLHFLHVLIGVIPLRLCSLLSRCCPLCVRLQSPRMGPSSTAAASTARGT
jgi:hypothetical protein